MTWFHSTPESEAVLAEERLVLSATEAVEEAMTLAGKNKQELAELLDVRPTEISQRLSGRRNLTLRTLARMLHVLGMRAELTLKPSLPAVRESNDAGESEEAAFSNVLSFQPREVNGGRNLPSAWGKDDKSRAELFWPEPIAAAR